MSNCIFHNFVSRPRQSSRHSKCSQWTNVTQKGKYLLLFLYQQDNAHVGDDFMNQIQTIAAYVPYMTCPGNHEQA